MPLPTSDGGITSWLRKFGTLSPADARKQVKLLGDSLAKLGPDEQTPLFGLVALRVLLSLLDRPDGKLFKEVVERVDGKLPTTIRTWRDDYVAGLKSGEIDPARLVEEFGIDLAQELFRQAGIDYDPGN